MGRKCCVPNCRSGYLVKNDSSSEEKRKLAVFSLPKHEDIRRKWIRPIPRDNWEPSTNSGVCQHHFKPGDFVFNRTATNEKCKKNKAPWHY